MNEQRIRQALKQAFQLGQDYWYQANHAFVSQNKKSDVTREKFEQLMEDAIKEVLAQSEQEPVGWYDSISGGMDFTFYKPHRKPSSPSAEWIPVYSRPPQRTWIGLTDEEYAKLAEEFGPFPINQIEAKLKEKNT